MFASAIELVEVVSLLAFLKLRFIIDDPIVRGELDCFKNEGK